MESSCPVRTNSWVWASTPGVTRTRILGRSEAGGTTRAGRRGAPPRRRSPPRCARRRPRARRRARRSTCCCRAGRAGRRAPRQSGRRGALRPRRRRGACPPRGPTGPWPGRGRPWWRRPHRHPRRRPPPGRNGAGGPRRRRTAAYRTRRPGRAGRCPRPGGVPPHPPRPSAAGGDARLAPWRRRGRRSGPPRGAWATATATRRGTTDSDDAGGTTLQNTAGRRRLRPVRDYDRPLLFVRPRGAPTRPRSSADRAPASGAGGAGSSPAGGALTCSRLHVIAVHVWL